MPYNRGLRRVLKEWQMKRLTQKRKPWPKSMLWRVPGRSTYDKRNGMPSSLSALGATKRTATLAPAWPKPTWRSHLPEPQVRVNTANDLQLAARDPGRDLLDFLSKPHSDPDLVKTCKEVLECIGAAPGE